VAGVECAAAAVAAALECTEEAVEERCTALAHQGQFLQGKSSEKKGCGLLRQLSIL